MFEYLLSRIVVITIWEHQKWKLTAMFKLFITTHLMLTIPILEIVAGEACLTSSVSNMKFTLFPNSILQPDGKVKSLPGTKVYR